MAPAPNTAIRTGTRDAISPVMTNPTTALVKKSEKGAMGYALAWLLGIPIPILLIVFLLRGCN
jgi:hypothetical protein